MKDKEKQIEEMAKATCTNVAKHCIDCKDCSEYSDCILVAHAINLYDDNYRKIPKDGVVLTKEEYDNIYEQAEQNVLANIADGGTSCHWCMEQHEKETVEKIVHLLADYKEYDYESCSYKDWCVPHTIIKHIAQSVGIDIRTLNDKPTKKPLKFNGVVIKE